MKTSFIFPGECTKACSQDYFEYMEDIRCRIEEEEPELRGRNYKLLEATSIHDQTQNQPVRRFVILQLEQ